MVKANYKPGLLENAVGQTSDGNFLFPASTKGGKWADFYRIFGKDWNLGFFSARLVWVKMQGCCTSYQCVNCETFPSLVNWNTNQFCLEPTQFSWGITIEIVLRYLCRLFSEASGATKPLISPTIHRQWGSFWKYANTGFGTSWKFSLFFRNERPDSLWF